MPLIIIYVYVDIFIYLYELLAHAAHTRVVGPVGVWLVLRFVLTPTVLVAAPTGQSSVEEQILIGMVSACVVYEASCGV